MKSKVHTTNPVDKTTKLEGFGIFVLVIAGIAMAWLSWLKWCDPIIDFGRELYIPWALCQGKILYKDINIFFYGPFSYYLNALLFKIFGIHIDTIVRFNLVLILIIAVLIYKIIKTVSNSACAFFSVLSFIILFAFPRYFPVLNDNFVTPYSHAATHGIALSFLAFFFLSLYLSKGRIVYAYLCWFVGGLVLLTKVEIFVGLFASMVVTWAWILRTEKPQANIIAIRSITFASLLILPLLLFGAYFARLSTFPQAILCVLNPYFLMFHRGHSFSPLLVRVMGADEPLANTGRMLYWLGIYVLFALIIMVVNHFLSALSKNTKYKFAPPLLAFLITTPFINTTISGSSAYLDYFFPLPMVVLCFVVYIILKLRKTGLTDIELKKNLITLSFSIFSLVLLARLLFNVRVVHYGFFLVLPGFLILLIIVLHILPALMKRITGDARFGMIPVIVLILFTLYSYFSHSVRQYNLIDYPIKSDHEVIKTFDLRYSDIGQIIQQAIDKINVVVEPDETFTVFPEGLMFNYLTRRESASPYTAFLPTFFSVFHGDILESLQEKPPDFVLLVERSTVEYGYRYFGIDYAADVFRWIEENYVEIVQIGKKPFSGEGFGIVIMKRMSS
ncbi:MAG: glycosyltransferase family 39 protein [Deltaproteobacteria bacterium]|nr:glycosyltransferase family 39 protein [Deltaproteobacteria bacterium]MBW2170523.1 glycosyltransferase family 39 protein [Deltaproteobacteria bacterium]